MTVHCAACALITNEDNDHPGHSVHPGHAPTT